MAHNSDEVARWYADNCEFTLRFDYPLSEGSQVIDLGGYDGEWAHLLHTRYNCHIQIYEPVPLFYQKCKERVLGLPKVTVHHCAVSDYNGQAKVAEKQNASSLYDTVESDALQQVRDIRSILNSKLDLLKINIEGAEYEVLLALISSGKISLINNIQVQFHRYREGHDMHDMRQKIYESLNRTHDRTYFYDWVWENWHLR